MSGFLGGAMMDPSLLQQLLAAGGGGVVPAMAGPVAGPGAAAPAGAPGAAAPPPAGMLGAAAGAPPAPGAAPGGPPVGMLDKSAFGGPLPTGPDPAMSAPNGLLGTRFGSGSGPLSVRLGMGQGGAKDPAMRMQEELRQLRLMQLLQGMQQSGNALAQSGGQQRRPGFR